MIKLTINHAKTILPLKKAAGTYEQRLQKAVELNEQFYKKIQTSFKNEDIPPRTFGKLLKETTDSPIKINITSNIGNEHKGKTGLFLENNGEIKGYVLYLPFSNYTGKISLASYRTFLKATQQFFDFILNPKYITRELSVISKGYDLRALNEFYAKNIEGNTTLTKKALNEFLKGKTTTEKIDLLQNLRYNLKLKAHESKMNILVEKGDKKIKENKIHEKIQIVEETLSTIISKERAKNKPKV